MTLDIKDRLYTSSEVAEILGVSLRSVYRYLEEGKLDADIKTATGRHRFSKKNILDFLQPSDLTSRNSNQDIKSKDIVTNEIVNSDVSLNSGNSKATFSPTEIIEDDFDFDNFFETEVVKKDRDISENLTEVKNETAVPRENVSKFLEEEDDLEKLFEELEKEFASSNSESNINNSEKKISKLADDDFEFDFDFLEGKESVTDYLKVDSVNDFKKEEKKLNEGKDDDFDFDFLDSFFESEEKSSTIKEVNSATPLEHFEEKKESTEFKKKEVRDSAKEESDFFNLDSIFSELFEDEGSKKDLKKIDAKKIEEEEKEFVTTPKVDESESWLERFRKASEKVSEPKTTKKDDDEFDLSNFFNPQSSTSSIVSNEEPVKSSVNDLKSYDEDFKLSRDSKKKEYYYISSLSGPKEIAQTIDKVSRKFDLDYAFTLNAGLSLHKDISPFTLINVYINERDLEIFEDYLKLTPSSEKDAHICLMMARDREIFEDSYELNGLFVVSNVQLRSDFIDKGMDNYAREV